MKILYQIMFISFPLLLSSLAQTRDLPQAAGTRELSGKFILHAMSKAATRGFILDFQEFSVMQAAATPRHIELEVGDLYANLAIDGIYEIDALIMGKTDSTHLLASQITVFMPSPEGKTPIILLSKKFPAPVSIKSSSFIKYHAPQSDFRIF